MDKTIALLYEKLNNLQTNDHEKTKAIIKLTAKINKIMIYLIKLKASVKNCQSQSGCSTEKETHNETH